MKTIPFFGRRAATGISLALVALSLMGCVTVLPKAKPVQLYGFEVGQPIGLKPSSASNTSERATLVLGRIQFPQAAASDRILTLDQGEQSYIAEARWTAPAQTLIAEQFLSGLSARVQRAEVLPATSLGKSSLRLEVDVTRFETLYAKRGQDPHVIIELRSRLVDLKNGQIKSAQTYRQDVLCKDNRVGEITRSYSLALTALVDQLAKDLDTSLSQ